MMKKWLQIMGLAALLLAPFQAFSWREEEPQAQAPESGPSVQELISQLQNPGPAERRKAAARLRSLGAKALPATWALVSALRDSDEGVRGTSYEALRILAGDPQGLGIIGQGLQLPEKQARLQVLRLLATGGSAAVHDIAGALDDRDEEVGRAAGAILRQMADNEPAAAQALKAARSDMDPVVRESAEVATAPTATTQAAAQPTPLPPPVFPALRAARDYSDLRALLESDPALRLPYPWADPPVLPPDSLPEDFARLKRALSEGSQGVRHEAITTLGQLGPSAAQAALWLKQVLNSKGSDDSEYLAAQSALDRILQPTEALDYFFELETRSDLCRLGLSGPVRKMILRHETDASVQEVTFDKNGFAEGKSFLNPAGSVSSRQTTLRDKDGNLVSQTLTDHTGITLLSVKAEYGAGHRKLHEVIRGDSPTALVERNYTYDGQGRLTRYEALRGMELEPLTLEFKYNRAGKLKERRVKTRHLAPEVVTRFKWDAQGNTLARWEYFENLPLVENSFFTGHSKHYGPRKILRYYWTYRHNAQGEKTGETLFWDDGLPRISTDLVWDDKGNNIRQVSRDAEGKFIEDNNLVWDAHQNLMSRQTHLYSNGVSTMESYSYQVDSHGNWTRRTGNLPYVLSGQPRGAMIEPMQKAPVLTREFEYDPDPSGAGGCPPGVNDRLIFVPAGLR